MSHMKYVIYKTILVLPWIAKVQLNLVIKHHFGKWLWYDACRAAVWQHMIAQGTYFGRGWFSGKFHVSNESHVQTKGRMRAMRISLRSRNGTLTTAFRLSYQVQGVSRCKNGLSESSKRSSKLTPEPSVLIRLLFQFAIHRGRLYFRQANVTWWRGGSWGGSRIESVCTVFKLCQWMATYRSLLIRDVSFVLLSRGMCRRYAIP